MSSAASKWKDWIAGFAAGCDRLVPTSVEDIAERARRGRFVGLVLSAPFFIVPAAIVVCAGKVDEALLAATLCVATGLSWLFAAMVAMGIAQGAIEIVTLVFAALGVASVVAAAGGLQAPVALMASALVVEAWWVRRSRPAITVATVFAVLALLSEIGLRQFFAGASQASAWQWIVPASYAALLWLRADGFAANKPQAELVQEAPSLETLVEGVVLHLGRNGDVRDASFQANDMLRLSPDLLLGSSFFDRIHIGDRVAYLCALADLREGAEQRRVAIRLRLPRDAGEERDNYRPFSVELMNAGADEFLALVRDNEELVLLHRDLAKAIESADSTEVAKSRFLAAVSHELRTPLNAILGFSDMLLQEMFGGFADPRQKEYVGIIRESGHHLLAVVNSILDVSKIEAGTYAIHPEPFAFVEAVESCAMMMTHQAAAKSLTLSQRVPQAIGEVCADRRAVQQILINLLSNAVKFTPEGGDIEIGAQKAGARIQFWVSDTGIGISEEDLLLLGRPFTQVRNDYTRQFEGTGLGLSLVKGLVALHQGTLSIESAPDKGTLVMVTLPIDGPIPTRKDEETTEPVTLPANGRYEAADDTKRKTA